MMGVHGVHESVRDAYQRGIRLSVKVCDASPLSCAPKRFKDVRQVVPAVDSSCNFQPIDVLLTHIDAGDAGV